MKISKSTNFNQVEQFLSENFSSPTHWPEWNLIVSKHYSTDFFYLVATNGKTIQGICPMHCSSSKVLSQLFSGQFMYIPYGGWIIKDNLQIVKKFFPLKIKHALTTFSLPIIKYFPDYSAKLNNSNFSTLIINLQNDEKWIWENSIDSKRRNMIRKAMKNQVLIEEVTTQNYDFFYDFYAESNFRYGLKSLKKECLSDLFFSTKTIGFLATFVRHEGRIISSNVLSHDKNYALYWLGSNAKKTPNLGQGELLQWEAIKNAKRMGCTIYDLCYIEKELLPTIYEFKKGFSKNEVPVVSLSIRPFTYRIINKIVKCAL